MNYNEEPDNYFDVLIGPDGKNEDLNEDELYNLNYNEIFYNEEDNQYYQFKGCDGMYGLFLKSDTMDFTDIKYDPVKYKDNFMMVACYVNLKVLKLEKIKNKKNDYE